MSKHDYVCSPEPIEKQLDDYKKSTTLWSSIANKYSIFNKVLIMIIALLALCISYLVGGITRPILITCEYGITSIPSGGVDLIEY